jgi:hypothetical protein
MKPTEDVSQFPENGMNTPETKLMLESCNGALSLDPSLSFNHANREVFRITHDGHMITGEGLSTDEATQQAAKLLIEAFEEQIKAMVDARVVNLRADLERFTGHGLLDCHAICDQRDAAVAERDQLRAEVERLKFYIATTIQPDEYAKVIKDLRAEVERLNDCCDELHYIIDNGGYPSGKDYADMTARAEKAEADTARLDWLDENMDYSGGGSGGTYSFFTPADVECGMLRYAIDAAIKEASK